MALKVGVIGATGHAGQQITKQGFENGLEMTAIVRNVDKAKGMFGDKAKYVQADVTNLKKEDFSGLDVVVDAFATAPEHAEMHVELAQSLISMFKGEDKPRLFFIFGAGSLDTGDGTTLLSHMHQTPGMKGVFEISTQQFKEFQLVSSTKDINWVGISASGQLTDGEKTAYTLGHNQILTNKEGKSVATYGTVAAAIVDEIINPQHHNERFTVVDD